MMLNAGIEVPKSWQLVPLKRITRFGYGEALTSDKREQGRIKVYGSNGHFDEHSKANTLGPCIIIGRKGSYGKLNYSDDPVFAVDTTFILDRRYTCANLRFLYYLLGTLGLDELSDDTAVPGLSRRKAYQALSPLPPLDAQRRIARFLDEKTARIDGLIEKKRALLDRLAEKRQALITRAVTKGLNPAAPMKPSGIDWIAEIPEHWELLPLKRRIVNIEQGWSPSADERVAADDEWGVLKSGCVNEGVYDEMSHKTLPSFLDPRPEIEVCPGDILMCRASGSLKYIGSTALVKDTRPRLMFSDKTYRLTLQTSLVDSTFFVYSMAAKHLREQVLLSVSGAEGLANNIAQSSVGEYLHSFPSLAEQVEIASQLDKSCGKLYEANMSISDSIQLLQDFRTALIAAAVTGRIGELQ